MCGILGVFFNKSQSQYDLAIHKALCALEHRGPNDSGIKDFHIGDSKLLLGHTRLSIIDLSAAGHQPMASMSGRYTIVFNGEIYNYKELRKELSGVGYVFQTGSDTEVLLAAWEQWGKKCLNRLVGMFSFAVYDQQCYTLIIVRDAFGIKPLFYWQDGNNFAFASEIPALLNLLPLKPEVNFQRSYDYLVHGAYDDTCQTFYKGIKHLPPAHFLELSLLQKKVPMPIRWWEPNICQSNTLSFEQTADELRERFLENVSLHLRSDVPLGAALSGGIDSTSVVCAMRHLEPDMPIHTFTYVARDTALDEEYWANQVNSHVGAIAHKVIVSPEELVADLEKMVCAQGEPFGSTSIYAQYRVYQAARQAGITVTLDGQGADELLAGYSGYPGYRILSLIEKGGLLKALKFMQQWKAWPGRSYKLAVMELGRVIFPDKPYTLARRLLGRNFNPTWLNNDFLRDNDIVFAENRPTRSQSFKGRRVVERLYQSLNERGLRSLLRHGDRNSMHYSIESRVPFLTTDLAEFLYSLPEEYLISPQGETKSVFRSAMKGIVPDPLIQRKDKIGFATPEKALLAGNMSRFRECVSGWADRDPIVDKNKLICAFDRKMQQSKDTNQLWRWINFALWYEFVTYIT